MRNTQIKIVQFVGSKYGEDMANELENRSRVIIPPPTFPQSVLDLHAEREVLVRNQQNILLNANRANLQLVEAELAIDPNNRTILSEKAKLSVEISQGEFDLKAEVPMVMTEA